MLARAPKTSRQSETATLRGLRIAKHFPYFLAAVEEQNLHRAAVRLKIAQSALSRHISELEHELGETILFQRQARGVTITEAGRVLAEDARRILLDIEEAKRRVQRVAHGDVGPLRLAFCEAMMRQSLLAAVLKRFRAEYPEVDLRVAPMISDMQRDRLRDGEIDIGFVIEEAGDAEDFHIMRVGVDRFVLAVPVEHRFAARRAIGLRELALEPLILPARQLSPRLLGRMMDIFDARGIVPRIAAEVATVDIAYGLVGAGIGLAIVTAAQPDRAPANILVKDMIDFDLLLTISMIRWRNTSERLADKFATMVETMI
jgi:DNA-binding transcriptional LysR family regulator